MIHVAIIQACNIFRIYLFIFFILFILLLFSIIYLFIFAGSLHIPNKLMSIIGKGDTDQVNGHGADI